MTVKLQCRCPRWLEVQQCYFRQGFSEDRSNSLYKRAVFDVVLRAPVLSLLSCVYVVNQMQFRLLFSPSVCLRSRLFVAHQATASLRCNHKNSYNFINVISPDFYVQLSSSFSSCCVFPCCRRLRGLVRRFSTQECHPKSSAEKKVAL